MAAVLGGLSLPLLSLLSTGEIAQRGYLVTPLVAVGVTAQMSTVVVSIALGCVKKTHLMAFSSLVAATLSLGLNIFLVPRYGITAAAATTLLAMLVDFAIRLRLAQRHVRLSIQWRRLTKAGIAAAALGAILFVLSPTGPAPLVALVLVSPIMCVATLVVFRVATMSDLRSGWAFAVGLFRRETQEDSTHLQPR